MKTWLNLIRLCLPTEGDPNAKWEQLKIVQLREACTHIVSGLCVSIALDIIQIHQHFMSEVSAHFDLTWQFCRALPREDENEEEGGGAKHEIRCMQEMTTWKFVETKRKAAGALGPWDVSNCHWDNLWRCALVPISSYYPLAFFPALRQVFTSCIRHIIYFTPLMWRLILFSNVQFKAYSEITSFADKAPRILREIRLFNTGKEKRLYFGALVSNASFRWKKTISYTP